MQTARDPARRTRQARAALAAFEAAERRRWQRRPSIWRQLQRAASLPDIAEASPEAGEFGKAAAYAGELLARAWDRWRRGIGTPATWFTTGTARWAGWR